MKRQARLVLIGLISVAMTAGAALGYEDAEGSTDHPLFNRMPDFYISDYRESDFDRMDFVDSEGQPMSLEGRKFYINYYIEDGAKTPSELQTIRNHTNAIQKVGGTVVFEAPGKAWMKLERGGRTTWVYVYTWNGGDGYVLDILEEESMDQVIVADADALAEEIRATGRAAVYGIHFDTGKAEVRPDSEPALDEIAKLLRQDDSLALYVVGHTDNAGGLDLNMDLSMARADAVVKVLVSRYEIGADRLAAHGVASLAPVATNETEEGRALNRRCELVKR